MLAHFFPDCFDVTMLNCPQSSIPDKICKRNCRLIRIENIQLGLSELSVRVKCASRSDCSDTMIKKLTNFASNFRIQNIVQYRLRSTSPSPFPYFTYTLLVVGLPVIKPSNRPMVFDVVCSVCVSVSCGGLRLAPVKCSGGAARPRPRPLLFHCKLDCKGQGELN